jgi:hypothetical protein
MSCPKKAILLFTAISLFPLILLTSSTALPDLPGGCLENSGPSDLSLLQKEITIRNVTKIKLRYTIKVYNSPNPPTEKTLRVGEVHHYTGDKALDISFWRDGEKIDYRLDPGESYSFRYDENNLIDIFAGSHGRTDVVDLAPYVKTPMDVVERMLEMAEVDKDDLLVDLGCGDGRIVITAAKKFGARGIGIDLEPQRIQESIANAKAAGVEELVEFRLEDATLSDFSQATVVTMYLLTESNELLRPHLERQLRFGTYVVSHNYPIERWESKLVDYHSFIAEDGKEHSIWVYRR